MPTLDLDPADLRVLQDILAHHVPQAEVWAYGSRVTGGAHEGSDLDLVIRARSVAAAPKAIARLRSALSESDLPMLVDVHDWARIPEHFRQEIKRSHAVIQ